MSHGKERKEKNCLNCGAQVQGPYCHICGQANTEPRESIGDLITHFVYDITHFDGKFFSTIRSLLFKPGFLTKEYLRGRRASYVNPVKMYIFTSAVFFLLTFWMVPASNDWVKVDGLQPLLEKRRMYDSAYRLANTSEEARKLKDSLRLMDSVLLLAEMTGLVSRIDVIDTVNRSLLEPKLKKEANVVDFGLNKLNSLAEYEKAQQAKALHEKDGWLKRYLNKKTIEINNRYRGRGKDFLADFSDKFLHSLPKMMLVSLPLVAFLLWLLYFRHRQKFNFVAHCIHVLHGYISLYLFITVLYLLVTAGNYTHWGIITPIRWLLMGYVVCYSYMSLFRVYGQSHAKTILKFLIFGFLLLIMYAFLSVAFVVNSILGM